MIESGLVIAPEWVAKALAGEKTCKIRSKSNARIGRIAIAEKGGPLVATCTIGRSIPLQAKDFATHFDKHCVKLDELRAFYGDRDVYAWPLSDVRPIRSPNRFKYPGGGSWVALSANNVSEFDRLPT